VSETISIKVQIANKTYPLKVSPEQEFILLKAAQLVNERMKTYETAYNVKDPQDLLAMCALQQSAELLGAGKNMEAREADIQKELEALSELVKAFGPDNQ
jgi:cell division protein ZapA (FtsZ GTPase activity inhibitor)